MPKVCVARPRIELPAADAIRALADGEGRLAVRVTPGARVERLERVADDDLLAGPDHVQQLPDGHRGRPLEVGALVVPGVGDDQLVGRRHQRVEQELAVLAAREEQILHELRRRSLIDLAGAS